MLHDHTRAPEENQSLTTESAADGLRYTRLHFDGTTVVGVKDFVILYFLSYCRGIDTAH